MKYLLLIPLLALTACSAPITKDSIRHDPVYTKTVSVDKPYQIVFADLLKKSRACYLDQPFKKQLTLVGNRDNGKKTANITLEYVYAMAEHDVIMMVDITSVEKNKTQVNVYTSDKSYKPKVDRVGEWATNVALDALCVEDKGWFG